MEGARKAMDDAFETLSSSRFDSRHGGFSGPPEFPRISEVNLVLLQSLLLKALGHQLQAGALPVLGTEQ